MSALHRLTILAILNWITTSHSIARLTPQNNEDNSDSDVFAILNTKDYLPKEEDLPKSSIINNVDFVDSTYILSKLSDQKLIKLLSQQPKRGEYNLNDLISIASSTKELNAFEEDKPISGKLEPQKAYFKLDDQEVEPYNYNNDADPKYNAYQKLNNILYSHPQQINSDEDDEKNEMLFDVLVAQLKALCCKKRKPTSNKNMVKLKSMLKRVIGQKKQKIEKKDKIIMSNTGKMIEYLFLVINDEIKSNVSDDLIVVDPDSLANNSTVLLLGPIATPLSDSQLKLVMSRIANELSKSEYLPLLQKISEGALDDSHSGLMKSLISGIDSRRYIKPHRCNHVLSKLKKNPKWLICTGYLNINTPSIYD